MSIEHHDPRLLRRLQDIVVVQEVVVVGGQVGRATAPQVGEGVQARHTPGQRRPRVEGGEGVIAVLGGGVAESLGERIRLDLQFGDLKTEKKRCLKKQH